MIIIYAKKKKKKKTLKKSYSWKIAVIILQFEQGVVARSDASSTGIQGFAGLILQFGIILLWRLVM